MERKGISEGKMNQQYLQERLNSVRQDNNARFLQTRQSAMTMNSKSIRLKPESVLEKARTGRKLIPSLNSKKTPSVGLRKTFSQQKLPGIRHHPSPRNLNTVLPPSKKKLTRRTLAGSSLQRVYSNPQFTKLNQDPYFRPKTSVFGYTNGEHIRKDPTKKAPWTSEPVQSITGVKTMTSLAPGNALLKKDKLESSPAKRSLSRKSMRKKTGDKSHRQTMFGTMYEKRPNTSYLLQNAAERMPWPQKPQGRAKLYPMTPVKAFTFGGDNESQFLHSEKDYKMTMENSI